MRLFEFPDNRLRVRYGRGKQPLKGRRKETSTQQRRPEGCARWLQVSMTEDDINMRVWLSLINCWLCRLLVCSPRPILSWKLLRLQWQSDQGHSYLGNGYIKVLFRIGKTQRKAAVACFGQRERLGGRIRSQCINPPVGFIHISFEC